MFTMVTGVLIAVLVGGASANVATPLGKVVELLDDLTAQVDGEGKKEAQLYSVFAAWCSNETRSAKETIEETSSEISELKSIVVQEEAFREGKHQDLEVQIKELVVNEADLKNATGRRKNEHDEYSEAETTFLASIDALQRSIEVLKKKQPADESGDVIGASSAAASAIQLPSLATIASNLRKTLEHSDDLKLTLRQKDTLDQFFRAAVDAQPGSYSDTESAVPAFLQVRQGNRAKRAQRGPFGDYESKTGGVQSTIQMILDKTSSDRDAAMKAEQEAKNSFDLFATSLGNEIKSGEESKTDMEMQIARSEQVSSQKIASLHDANEILQATQDQLDEVNAQFKARTDNYKVREGKRSEELKALQQAIHLLTSDAAKHFKQLQTIGEVEDDKEDTVSGDAAPGDDPAGNDSDDEPPTFIQTQVAQGLARRKAIALVKSTRSPGLVLLALRAQTRVKSQARVQTRDPFDKVKDMIQQMLERLLRAQNEEAEHHSWCETETAKSEKSRHKQEKEIRRLQDRIDGWNADIETLGDDLSQLSIDLSDMAQALVEATTARNEERAAAKVAIKEFHDAQGLIKNALTVLQEFYGKAGGLGGSEDPAALLQGQSHGKQAPPVPGGAYKSKDRAASGVIGILEVAVQDFHEQEKEATMQESAAQQAYEELMSESEIKRAVFLKDTEYKTREKVKLENDVARTGADLRTYKQELAAVLEYTEKLQQTCVAKGSSYAERKSRREAELESLRTALQVLNGEAIA